MMNPVKQFYSTKHTLLLFVLVGMLQACSDSGSPSSNPVTNSQSDPATGIPVSGVSADNTGPPSNVGVPDPLVQNNTDITFEITVPAYQSNQLQLRLNWGEFSTSVNWVGDELWSTNAVLPTDTERLLSIVFFDENGDIELASYEQMFRTGNNAAEVYQVSADQFDTDQWDFDGDGVSNMDELIVGTDPRVDEESLIPIIDNQDMSLVFIANYFESLLPTSRPYMGTEDESAFENEETYTTADIDADGNGSLFISTGHIGRRNHRTGERTVLDNAIQWSGSWTFSDDFHLNQGFDSEVSIEGDSRRLVEQGSGSWVGTYSHRWETTVDVTGQLIDGSSYCAVSSGTITEYYRTNQEFPHSVTLTITRESADDPWHVTRDFERDGEISTSEYLARELSMHMIRFGYQRPVSENDYFYCDFGDL